MSRKSRIVRAPRADTHRTLAAKAVTALTLAAGLAAPASALTINLTFDANVPGAVGTAGTVRHLINSAATMWEDWIEDTHTLTLTIGWTNTGGSTLAVHTLSTEGGTPHREISGNIDFGNQWTWFIDSTPFEDEEFGMASTLWRDVSATNQAAWFNGTALPVFEVGRTGNATAAAAMNATDMLSVALHEIGHALGMSSANNATIAQTADGDYDFSTTLTRGGALAARVASGSNIAHLQCGLACMFPSVGQGIRRLPSPTDIFSTASGSQWTDIDLDRKFFHASNGDWNTNGNWIGNDQTDSTEDAYISHTSIANVTTSEFARRVFVTDGSDLDIESGGTLTVGQLTTIDGDNSDLFIFTGGVYNANGGMTLQNGDAQLQMSGGTLNVNGNLRLTDSAQDIIGQGTIAVNGGDLINDGNITASGGNLVFNSAAAGTWDLDGGVGNGVLNATGGDITFNGTLNDAFDGVANISADRTLTFSSGGTWGAATLTFNTGTTDATLAGGTMTLSNVAIAVTGTGQAVISAPVITSAGMSAVVDADETLRFTGATTLNGGSFTGAGEFETDGNTTVTGNTTINTGTYDFDGDFLGATTTINSAATFTINSNIADAIDETITVNGDLIVNSPSGAWTMSDALTINNGGTVGGTAELNLVGSIDANGTATVTGPIEFFTSSVTTVTAATDRLLLNGATRFGGGSYTGLGEIEQNGDATVVANTTLSVGTYDMDGMVGGGTILTVNNGVTFTLNVGRIESDMSPTSEAFNGTANVDGTMNVNTTSAWTNGGVVDLISGVVGGSGIVNEGTFQGAGTINAASFDNSGTISAQDGSTLNLNTTAFPDLDGSSETGVLNALAGGIRILGNFGGEFGFDGTINIGSGRTFRMDNTGIFNSGEMNITGGTYLAPTFTQIGDLNVNAGNATLSSATRFAPGGVTNLNAATSILRINGSATLDAGHNLNGPGQLEILAGSTLDGNGTAATDVLNRGTIRPGTSVGTLTVTHSYQQAATGAYAMEISADGVNDRIAITAGATLDGALNISFLGGFAADWGDEWTIMTYGSHTGDFSSFTAPALSANLYWWREVNATDYRLGVRAGGDLDHDGDVDFVDLNFVLTDFGNSGGLGAFGMRSLLGDADEDGFVGFLDLNLVLTAFGTIAPIPAPGAAALALMGLGLAIGRGRRERVA